MEESRDLVQRVVRGLLRLEGPVKVRITLDVLMDQHIKPNKKRESGFRSTLRSINTEDDIPNFVDTMFTQIETSIEHYNSAGMSGCYVSRIKGLRLLAIRYQSG